MSQIQVANSGGGGGSVQTINGDSGSITGSAVTLFADHSTSNCGASVQFVNSGTISTLHLTDAFQNTFIGKSSGNLLASGAGANTALGESSLGSITSGDNNVAVGVQALLACTTATFNVAIGTMALEDYQGSDTVAIGGQALTSLTTGANNTAIGHAALQDLIDGSNNTCIGIATGQGSVSGNHNVAVGAYALNLNTGDTNTVVGSAAGASAGSASQNTLVGFQTGNAISGGGGNTGIGFAPLNHVTSGAFNTGCGWETLFSLVSGSYNTALGYNAGSQLNAAESSNIYISHVGVTGENNAMRLGTTGSGNHQVNKAYIAATFGTTVGGSGVPVVIDNAEQIGTVVSSIKYKENVHDMGEMSSDILKLRPIIFNYISDQRKSTQYGLIAEEVDQVMPHLVARNKEGEVYSVKYLDLPVLLLNEMKRINKRLQDLELKVSYKTEII